MPNFLLEKVYKADVLSCLANLSNDEVFTPPTIVNNMLDMLPQELFCDPNTTFLDPACKSGVFLREIAKRLIDGLEPIFPDREQRIEHIFKNQIFGIAITELTSLLSRRSVYCSKYPNSKYSVVEFEDSSGNIKYHRIQHTFDAGGRCIKCGASKDQYSRSNQLETHAYQFIHLSQKEIENMKFDVIISNPPYQLSDGGAQASAKPIYHYFVDTAKKLKPRYIVMITPSRWFSGGKGLDKFRDTMLHDDRIREIHDFLNASDCFPGVEIKGGVSYFLWDRDSKGLCKVFTHEDKSVKSVAERKLLEENSDVFIRYNEAISILHKVLAKKEKSFSEIVSSRKPFGLPTNYEYIKKTGTIKIYANKRVGYLEEGIKIQVNEKLKDMWKIFIPKAIGSGDIRTDKLNPIIVGPNTICTETYIVIGPFSTKQEATNCDSYVRTRFFHFMLGLKKNTQDATRQVYQFVPLQDFSKPWTDEELYQKYDLTQDEIDFIESNIQPME